MRSNIAILLSVLAISIAWTHTLPSRAQPTPQYKVDNVGVAFGPNWSAVNDILNKNAESGWQLVNTFWLGGATGYIVLISKR